MTGHKTIALCCNTAFAIANFRGGLVRELIARGHRVVVIAPADPVHFETLRRAGAECIDWPLSARGVQPWSELLAIRRLTRIFRAVKPDLVFNYTIKSVIYGGIAASRAGVRSVAVITGLGYVFLNKGWVSRAARALYTRTLRHSREVWFLNSDDLTIFREFGFLEGVDARSLPGEGVDTDHFAPAARPPARDGRPFTFLMIGRLLKDKGTLEFVAAARILRRSGIAARCQLLGAAGEANPTAIGSDDVKAWSDEGIIEYLGTMNDVRPAIAQADCIVLPSYREGLPRSLMEAAAMERPLIATDVPGCREVVVPGVSGQLCQVRDAESLAQRMREMANLDEAALTAMGRAGRAHVVERFDERSIIQLYLEALERLTPPVA